MRLSKRLPYALAAVSVLLLAGGVLAAKTRKGDRNYAQGQPAEVRKQWDKALEFYEKALAEDPSDTGYEVSVRRVRFQAAQGHVDLGQKLRAQGKLDEALAEFQKAYAIDPSSSVAEQELRRTVEMIERNKKSALEGGDKGLTPAELARKEEAQRISELQGAPELKPLSQQPINLRMANQPPRILFETVGKLAGVNVIFDPDYRNDPNATRPVSVELNNATLEEALDNLAAMTKVFWKPLSSSSIFITADNQAKRREYEDNVVRVFYLSNLTTPQELQEIQTTLRTVADIRRLFVYNAQSAIIVRGTTDQVALAEALINDLDKPKSEVVVDVLVMEVNRSKDRDLAATLASVTSSGLSPGLQTPVSFTPRNPALQGTTGTSGSGTTGGTGTSTSTAISLAKIGHVSTNDFSVTMPSALLQAVLTDRSAKVLQSPQVRAANGQKASLKIGDREPVSTGGIQPYGTTTGTLGGGLYQSFNFIDVGVNVDITPTVHINTNEVTLKVELDVSSVNDRIDIGGISQPVIGQRKVTHEIRIKEGEMSLLGGLMQVQETRSTAGVPGLMSIPVLRRLFSSETLTRSRQELLICLVPHIVRTPDLSDMNLKGIASGPEQVIHVTRARKAAPAAAPQPPVAVPGTTPAPAAPQPPQPGFQPGPQPAGPPAPPEAAAPAKPAGAPRVFMNPPMANAAPGSTFTVQLEIENAQDLFAAPFHLRFDPQVLRLTDVSAGRLLSGDGQQIIFTRNILNDTGDVTVNLNRKPGTGGVSGSGVLATFTFQTVKPGTARITFSDLALRDARLQPINLPAPAVAVTVK